MTTTLRHGCDNHPDGFHIFDNLTGQIVRQDLATEADANFYCNALNTTAGPGNRYVVRDHLGRRNFGDGFGQ